MSVATAAKHASHAKRSLIFHHVYIPNPKPINLNTLGPTKLIAEDASHPFHIRTLRRLEAFDPTKLHLIVKCPANVSKKASIRKWASRRVKTALERELESRGWSKDGSPLQDSSSQKPLSGSLALFLLKDKSEQALTASDEDVRQNVGWVLDKVLEKRARPDGSRAPKNRERRHRPDVAREDSDERSQRRG